MVDFKKQDPQQLVTRLLILQHIRMNFSPDEVEQIAKGTMFVEELFDEDGKEAMFFNWEAILFDIPLPELEYMGIRLEEKFGKSIAEAKQAVVNGIVDAQTKDEIEKQRLKGLALSGADILDIKLKSESVIKTLVGKNGESLV